jgi:hypothetical protein
MADGYLESKREQYEARKAQWLRQKPHYSIGRKLQNKPKPSDNE